MNKGNIRSKDLMISIPIISGLFGSIFVFAEIFKRYKIYEKFGIDIGFLGYKEYSIVSVAMFTFLIAVIIMIIIWNVYSIQSKPILFELGISMFILYDILVSCITILVINMMVTIVNQNFSGIVLLLVFLLLTAQFFIKVWLFYKNSKAEKIQSSELKKTINDVKLLSKSTKISLIVPFLIYSLFGYFIYFSMRTFTQKDMEVYSIVSLEGSNTKFILADINKDIGIVFELSETHFAEESLKCENKNGDVFYAQRGKYFIKQVDELSFESNDAHVTRIRQ